MGRRIGIMGDEVGVRKWKRGVEREKVVADSWMSEVEDEGVGVCMRDDGLAHGLKR